MYQNDDWLFQQWLKFKRTGKKLWLINGGLGDHYIFRQVITPSQDDVLAVCYPAVFPEHKCISIAEAEQLVDKKDYDVYEWATQMNWRGTLQDAYLKLYEHINNPR